MIICKIDCNIDMFIDIVRALYPYDEYHIVRVDSSWSWRHWDAVPTAWLERRSISLSEAEAQHCIAHLQAGKPITMPRSDYEIKVIRHIFNAIHPSKFHVSYDRWSIEIKPL